MQPYFWARNTQTTVSACFAGRLSRRRCCRGALLLCAANSALNGLKIAKSGKGRGTPPTDGQADWLPFHKIFFRNFFCILFFYFSVLVFMTFYGIDIGYYFLIFIFLSVYMFIKFDLRPFSSVLSDLFIFVDNFLVLANKSALNRLILRHCYLGWHI